MLYIEFAGTRAGRSEVDRFLGMEEVRGSNPRRSIIYIGSVYFTKCLVWFFNAHLWLDSKMIDGRNNSTYLVH